MAMLEYNPPRDPWVEIVFEDEHILAINKPSGLLSVPGRLPEHHDSAWSRVLETYPDAQVVHRLDMDTSGLMVLAKNKRAESALKKQFQYRLTHKVYYARVWGHVEQSEGVLEFPLICDWENRPRQKVCYETGKPSKTIFQVAKYEENTTIVRLLPVTGRSHQLRVHMQALGHPIVGDEFYSEGEAFSCSDRLALHAAELSFYHPRSHWLRSIFVPCDFYPEAEEMIFNYFDPVRKLPDYKTLPRP
ncbi:bifunctional tRNA pseudouridine(32) synthase/23S rRNA pseudouridine(746) synthase RluA [Vibrio ponticus]|uniref:Pseudouridine synthase n=1 Tax=Vibrio ponticus TaxID=265668 RepID=A0A3N3E5P1_9VIBR|nr:bifunctional tRNA pseudouridine(32) synthase/23S rRNA pseudouridine(746) synthase RluA [Vibrio ponticus]ROV61828.1 bifunctional tRNA pseudouridine(32) synthase/23S rRNA pseudouridine(746) synthase RluA [Vibrio ponticus]